MSALRGKTIFFLGSSWTYGSATDGKVNFAKIIADKNCMTMENQSVSGTTLAVRDGREDSYVERLSLFPCAAPDYLMVQVGSNDAAQGVPLGTLTDFYCEDHAHHFDCRTTAGAMEAIASRAMMLWPSCRVMWYTGFNGTFYNDSEKRARYEAAVALALKMQNKWATPVCDLYHSLGVNTFVPSVRVKFTSGDGAHPNQDGYEQLWAPFIEHFLEKF